MYDPIPLFPSHDANSDTEKLDQIIAIIPLISSLVPMVCEMAIRQSNLWTPSVISEARGKQHRTELMKKLGYDNNRKLPKCMVTAEKGNGDKIVCGHLVPCSSKQDKLSELNIDVADLNCSENCVFWCSGIEKMYQDLKVSFLKSNPLRDVYILKCWTDGAKSEPLWNGSTKTVGDCEGKELRLGKHVIWKRALSYQAYQGFLASNFRDDVQISKQALYGLPTGPKTVDYPFWRKARMLRQEFDKIRDEETEV